MIRAAIAVLALAAVAAAQGNWSVVASGLLTTELGVAFETPSRGYVAGDANGAGPEILRTIDGGKTFKPMNASFGIDLLLLAMTSTRSVSGTIIVTSVFGELYSNDGSNFKQSIGGGTSQDVRYLGQDGDGNHKFGCAGTYRGQQGVALTTNGGHTFSPVFAPVLHTEARYAAFPSDNVWYIAAGQWPGNSSGFDTEASYIDPATKALPRRARKSVFQDENGRFPSKFVPKQTASKVTDAGYMAQIARTADGGKTWTSVFSQNGTIYMNGIDCTSETHCCAVGESSDPPAAGAYIYCTDDGTTWTKRFNATQTSSRGFSLMDVRFATPLLGWAVGGELTSFSPKAWFVETTDGGKTWNQYKNVINGYYALGLDVINANVAYAAVDNVITQQSGVAKWTSS